MLVSVILLRMDVQNQTRNLEGLVNRKGIFMRLHVAGCIISVAVGVTWIHMQLHVAGCMSSRSHFTMIKSNRGV